MGFIRKDLGFPVKLVEIHFLVNLVNPARNDFCSKTKSLHFPFLNFQAREFFTKNSRLWSWQRPIVTTFNYEIRRLHSFPVCAWLSGKLSSFSKLELVLSKQLLPKLIGSYGLERRALFESLHKQSFAFIRLSSAQKRQLDMV